MRPACNHALLPTPTPTPWTTPTPWSCRQPPFHRRKTTSPTNMFQNTIKYKKKSHKKSNSGIVGTVDKLLIFFPLEYLSHIIVQPCLSAFPPDLQRLPPTPRCSTPVGIVGTIFSRALGGRTAGDDWLGQDQAGQTQTPTRRHQPGVLHLSDAILVRGGGGGGG